MKLSLIGSLIAVVCITGCTTSKVKKYESLLNPKIGQSKKAEINTLLGNPVFSKAEGQYEKCEYRSAYSQNDPIPDMFKKSDGLALDLSPYEYFDVLHLYFDSFHILKEWEPVVLGR